MIVKRFVKNVECDDKFLFKNPRRKPTNLAQSSAGINSTYFHVNRAMLTF